MQHLSEDSEALLTRLSQKPGVQSTLVLSRASGSIVRTSGLIATVSAPSPNATLPSNASITSKETSDSSLISRRASGSFRNAEEVARMVWSFMRAAGGLVEGLDPDDELKLLRIRTKRNELVIVPGMEFYFRLRAQSRSHSGWCWHLS